MSVKLSTFGQTEENIATLEQAAQPTTPVETPVETPAAPIVPEAAAPETPAAETPAAEPQEIDYSTSSFSLGGEETPAAAQLETPAAAQPQPQFNLDEELKKADWKELAKKIGFDDFEIELREHRSNGGAPLDYLNAKSIDYTQISDENIIKDNLRKQYPTFTPSQIDLYYTRKYGVSEEAADDEREFASLQLKADAHNLRQQLVEKQKQFKIPEAITPVKDEAYEQWKQNSAKQANIAEQINGFYQNHAATKTLHENKKVAINVGEGIKPLNFTIDRPEVITNSFTDGGKTWERLTSTETGEPDVQKQQLIALFSFNPQKFIQDVFNYGTQHGRRSLVSEGQNAHRPETKILPINPDQKPVYGVSTFGSKQR